MTRRCSDCGTVLIGGCCPNCDEEAYILDTQYEYMDIPCSHEFIEKAELGWKRTNERNKELKQ